MSTPKKNGLCLSQQVSLHAGEGVDELHLDVREGIDVLDGEVFAAGDDLPFADGVREGFDQLNPDIGKRRHLLDLDVRETVDDLDFAGKADALVIPVG